MRVRTNATSQLQAPISPHRFFVLLLTLSLKTLVLSLIEVFLHDRILELYSIVDLEGLVSLPRNDVVQAMKFTFFKHNMKLPRKRYFAVTGCLRQ